MGRFEDVAGSGWTFIPITDADMAGMPAASCILYNAEDKEEDMSIQKSRAKWDLSCFSQCSPIFWLQENKSAKFPN
jgi:hypothetical protein